MSSLSCSFDSSFAGSVDSKCYSLPMRFGTKCLGPLDPVESYLGFLSCVVRCVSCSSWNWLALFLLKIRLLVQVDFIALLVAF